jgi:dTDP-4-amino-4,6-dideoxy-D-galactose acyltransferase
MKTFTVESVPWDSEFFGFPVGKLSVDSNSSLSEIKKSIDGFEVCYVFSAFPLENDINTFQDEKVIFQICLNDLKQITENPIVFGLQQDFEKLVPLALASGEFSRFRMDPKFALFFERLYTEWLAKSLNRVIADEVLVYQKENRHAGFITFKRNTENVEIGLIAIDKDFRGQGIGSSLINAAFNYTSFDGFRHLTVATQRRNEGAINFYKKNGFTEVGSTFVYHLWK